jgi:hypothetical protein
LKKSIKVYTNDPKNEKIALQLSGTVKKFVTIKPSKVFLKGNVGESISQVVTITPGENEVFKIIKDNALKGVDYKYSLKEIEIDGKAAYELTVENTRETEGRYFDKIYLITDRTDQQPISIIVSGYLTNPPDQASEKQDQTSEEKSADAVTENKPETAVE